MGAGAFSLIGGALIYFQSYRSCIEKSKLAKKNLGYSGIYEEVYFARDHSLSGGFDRQPSFSREYVEKFDGPKDYFRFFPDGSFTKILGINDIEVAAWLLADERVDSIQLPAHLKDLKAGGWGFLEDGDEEVYTVVGKVDVNCGKLTLKPTRNLNLQWAGEIQHDVLRLSFTRDPGGDSEKKMGYTDFRYVEIPSLQPDFSPPPGWPSNGLENEVPSSKGSIPIKTEELKFSVKEVELISPSLLDSKINSKFSKADGVSRCLLVIEETHGTSSFLFRDLDQSDAVDIITIVISKDAISVNGESLREDQLDERISWIVEMSKQVSPTPPMLIRVQDDQSMSDYFEILRRLLKLGVSEFYTSNGSKN